MSVIAAIAKQIFVVDGGAGRCCFLLLSVVATKLNHKGALPRYIRKGAYYLIATSRLLQNSIISNKESFEYRLFFLRSIAQFFYTNLHELFCQFIS